MDSDQEWLLKTEEKFWLEEELKVELNLPYLMKTESSKNELIRPI